MKNLYEIEKLCGFYVSNMHFATMIMPYINKKIKMGVNFYTFFESDLRNDIKIVLDGIIGNIEEKENLLKIDWSNFGELKYSAIERKLKKIVNQENIILVCGREEYIKIIDENIHEFIEKNMNRLENKRIKIINCFELNNFSKDIREILNKYDKLINTSGEQEISEIFEGYEKNVI